MADPNAYEVLDDTTAPQLLAVLDGSDALYLLFDELVEPQPGIDLTTAMGVGRPDGGAADGAATRLTGRLFKWEPEGVGTLAGSYKVTPNNRHDLAGNLIPGDEGHSFTHPPIPPFNTTSDLLLLAYQAPTNSQPEAQSAYGLTTLFQGRTWHADLGMYYHRARWYLAEAGVFGEKDPMGYRDSPDLNQAFGHNATIIVDPRGMLIRTGEKELVILQQIPEKLGFADLAAGLFLGNGLVTIPPSEMDRWEEVSKKSMTMDSLRKSITDSRVDIGLRFTRNRGLQSASGAVTFPPNVRKRAGHYVWQARIEMDPEIIKDVRFKLSYYGDWSPELLDVALVHELGHAYGATVLGVRDTHRVVGMPGPTDQYPVDREDDYRRELGLQLRYQHPVTAIVCPGGDMTSDECQKRVFCVGQGVKSTSEACQDRWFEHQNRDRLPKDPPKKWWQIWR